MVAGQARIYAERLLFLRTSVPPTPRWHPCTLGLGEESERFARCHATGGRERDTLGVHERERDGPFLGGRRPNHQREVFETYLWSDSWRPHFVRVRWWCDGRPLFSQGREGQGAHRRQRLRALLYLPPYSPELDPIEEAFAKLKALLGKAGARTREALIEAMGRALEALTAWEACGFFEHRGYRAAAQLL